MEVAAKVEKEEAEEVEEVGALEEVEVEEVERRGRGRLWRRVVVVVVRGVGGLETRIGFEACFL